MSCVEVQSFLAFRWFVPCVCVNLQGRCKKKYRHSDSLVDRSIRIVRQLRAIPGEYEGVEGEKSSFSSRGSRKEKKNALKERRLFLGGGGGQLFAYFLFSPGILGT